MAARPVISGWEWDGTAGEVTVSGLTGNRDKAVRDAEDWLRANPGGTAVLAPAVLADGSRTLHAFWLRGASLRARRMRDGRIVWARVPRREAAS
jgi:hypothetical protein